MWFKSTWGEKILRIFIKLSIYQEYDGAALYAKGILAALMGV